MFPRAFDFFCQRIRTCSSAHGFHAAAPLANVGQRTKLFGNNKKQFSILDKEGKKVEFNSMIDALNFMTTNGYVFEQAYTVTIGQSNVYHFLMSIKI